MPKRKADQSADEWLKEGAAIEKDRRTLAATNHNQESSQTLPTAEGPSADNAIAPNPGAGSTVATPGSLTQH